MLVKKNVNTISSKTEEDNVNSSKHSAIIIQHFFRNCFKNKIK